MKYFEILWENDFFWAIGILLLYMVWRKRFEPRKEPPPVQESEPLKPGQEDDVPYDWLGNFLYLSNGREIPAPHVAYYIVQLGLEDAPSINPKTIEKAYNKCLRDVVMLRREQQVKVDIAGLKAARDFLTDRYCFVGYLN
jgi:hypothetical protein